nr:hypothetical protein [uncultured Prevotella sp.]
MTLPIVESILLGELRPNHIEETVSAEKRSLIMRLLRNTNERNNLIELEKDIKNGLGDLTHVIEQYGKDESLKKAITMLNRPTDSISYTRISKYVLHGILEEPPISNPTLKMYKTILSLEKMRTIWALVDLHSTMKDDKFIRPEIKKLLKDIKKYTQEVKAWNSEIEVDTKVLLQNMLTELYFSLIHTFSPVLYHQEKLDFDDDFEDFVFSWKGVFPSEKEIEKYKEEVERIKKDNAKIRKGLPEVESSLDSQKATKQEPPMTKAEKFLADTKLYEFMKMPKIIALDSQNEATRKKKALQLIESFMESPAHAAAMLDYLEFYKWIKDKYEKGYTLTTYDIFCTKVVMGIDGNAFKKYRLALNSNSKTLQHYQSKNFVEKVKDEYLNIINDIQ